MARSEGAEGPEQHLADAIAAAFARTEQPGEHLAVHAPKLAIEPRLQILRRHRRSLLLRLEHPYCSAVEDHVNRAPGVGLHRSFNLRIGISHRERFLLICDRLVQRFSTPFSPRRKGAKKQKKPQSARQHREQLRRLRRRDSVDAAATEILHGIPQLTRTYPGAPEDAVAM